MTINCGCCGLQLMHVNDACPVCLPIVRDPCGRGCKSAADCLDSDQCSVEWPLPYQAELDEFLTQIANEDRIKLSLHDDLVNALRDLERVSGMATGSDDPVRVRAQHLIEKAGAL